MTPDSQKHLTFNFATNPENTICTKGQLISKGLFSILNSSKKRTKKFNLTKYSGRLVFVHFLEEFEDTKKSFRN